MMKRKYQNDYLSVCRAYYDGNLMLPGSDYFLPKMRDEIAGTDFHTLVMTVVADNKEGKDLTPEHSMKDVVIQMPVRLFLSDAESVSARLFDLSFTHKLAHFNYSQFGWMELFFVESFDGKTNIDADLIEWLSGLLPGGGKR